MSPIYCNTALLDTSTQVHAERFAVYCDTAKDRAHSKPDITHARTRARTHAHTPRSHHLHFWARCHSLACRPLLTPNLDTIDAQENTKVLGAT